MSPNAQECDFRARKMCRNLLNPGSKSVKYGPFCTVCVHFSYLNFAPAQRQALTFKFILNDDNSNLFGAELIYDATQRKQLTAVYFFVADPTCWLVILALRAHVTRAAHGLTWGNPGPEMNESAPCISHAHLCMPGRRVNVSDVI